MNIRKGIIVILVSTILSSCQEASDVVSKGKQLLADNIEITCIGSNLESAPMSLGNQDQKQFYTKVGIKLLMDQDFSKQAILEAVKEVAANQQITCNGTAVYNSIQLNLSESNGGYARTAIEAYLDNRGYKLPIAITTITKKGNYYVIDNSTKLPATIKEPVPQTKTK